MPKARIVYNFGRADLVDRDGLARPVKWLFAIERGGGLAGVTA